jgi:NADH-quinone oxidoreductase subunit J
MFIENVLFFLFSILSIVFSFFVILCKNPVHSILSLIFVFFNTAALLIFLGAEFLAMLFVIVYVGAVAVLFLFVIMMLNIKESNLILSLYNYIPVFILLITIFVYEVYTVYSSNLMPLYMFTANSLKDHDILVIDFIIINFLDCVINYATNIYVIGNILYTEFFLMFFISGIILLVAMIGSITLTLHKRNDVKRQFVFKQIERNFNNTIIWRS